MQRRPCVLIAAVLATFSSFTPAADADVRLPAIFSEHMVLARDTAVPVWGWADPGEEVKVSFAGQTQVAKSDATGRWSVKLTPLAVAEPRTMTIHGKNAVTIPDVLVGEVWLASGQSNMAMTVNRTLDFEKEQAAADHPQIRMFVVKQGAADKPQTDCQGEWLVCKPDSVARFSATAYFFGRELNRELGVPVGLINSSVGGTPIESWISADAQQKLPELAGYFAAQQKAAAVFDEAAATAKYQRDLEKWKQTSRQAKAAGKTAPRRPQDPVEVRKRKGNTGGLFNGMIAPLAPYAIRGAIWYQGEANSTPEKAAFYQHQLPLLVRSWRELWGQGAFPVAWVQLPNFGGPGRNWPLVREAMLKSLAVEHTGMAIAIDIGETADIHPKNKQDVGRRLAMWALADVYGRSVASSGPLPKEHQVRGSEIVVSFSHTDGGLTAKGGSLQGFVIAGEDRKWHPAEARIEGEQVIVRSPAVTKPAAVRYAWENNPTCNLYNGACLPASPFRTDDWPPP